MQAGTCFISKTKKKIGQTQVVGIRVFLAITLSTFQYSEFLVS